MFKFFFRYFHDMEIAVESIVSNKLKSMLTALGIIFGVAAVIAMLAIGKGAKQEIMEQMKMVGVNNILINPIIQDQTTSCRCHSRSAAIGKKNQPGNFI
jgi:ABC-type lipoprotein release transport system permease subunit